MNAIKEVDEKPLKSDKSVAKEPKVPILLLHIDGTNDAIQLTIYADC